MEATFLWFMSDGAELQGFTYTDVYACESKYCKTSQTFRKVKQLSNVAKAKQSVATAARTIPMLPTRARSAATASEEEKKLPLIPFSNKPIVKERKVGLIRCCQMLERCEQILVISQSYL